MWGRYDENRDAEDKGYGPVHVGRDYEDEDAIDCESCGYGDPGDCSLVGEAWLCPGCRSVVQPLSNPWDGGAA